MLSTGGGGGDIIKTYRMGYGLILYLEPPSGAERILYGV